MATVADLKPSISQMSEEEAFALVKDIRFLRRQPPPKKARKSATRQKKPVSIKAQAKALTKEQKLQLLKELGG